MNNLKIRRYAEENKVCLWQIADKLGMMDFNFSRKLRKELSEDETERILSIIDEIANEREKA